MNINRYLHKKFRIGKDNLPPYINERRKKSREDLYDAFAYLDFKIGVEIGVQRGRNASQMCKRIPDLQLTCVDPWTLYLPGMKIERVEKYYEMAKNKLKNFNIKWMRMTSMEAVKTIKDGSLDFIHIDGAHDFDNVIMDLIAWCPKVKKGGIISGHDYIPITGVIKAVNAYIFAHGIHQIYITGDWPTSFFWVK